MISIRNLRKSFGQQVVLDGIDIEIDKGETIAVVGPSGTGKSVLLKIITGLLLADSGDVLIENDSMTAAKGGSERRRICSRMGILFQAAALFDSFTLLENVAFPLKQRREKREREVMLDAMRCLDDVGLQGYENALPGEVSIGMRKRVGIARALITKPDIILFDEPNTGLDPQTGQEIYDLIKKTHETSRFTGIVISHEIPEVFQVCQRVVMLYQGKVQHAGRVDEFLLSQNPVVKQFVTGDVNGPIQIC